MAKISIPTTDSLMTTTTIQTSNYTAKDFEHILCDTTGGAFTITLPLSPAVDSKITITDVADSFGANSLTINPNGNDIDNQASDVVLDESQSITYFYSTNGWVRTATTLAQANDNTGLIPTDIKTANYTAVKNDLVLCDTTLAGFEITLPALPVNGDKVGILDVANRFSSMNAFRRV
jgi:hypothetical protein